MKLVCDEGVERQIVTQLREAGREVTYVAEIYPGATDDQVLTRATQAGALLVNSDKDCGELVYRLGRAAGG